MPGVVMTLIMRPYLRTSSSRSSFELSFWPTSMRSVMEGDLFAEIWGFCTYTRSATACSQSLPRILEDCLPLEECVMTHKPTTPAGMIEHMQSCKCLIGKLWDIPAWEVSFGLRSDGWQGDRLGRRVSHCPRRGCHLAQNPCHRPSARPGDYEPEPCLHRKVRAVSSLRQVCADQPHPRSHC